MECYTAIREGIPIVALNCEGKDYDFAASSDLLTHLDSALEQVNPGAAEMLAHKASVDMVDMAFHLSTVIPSIISIQFNSSASSNIIAASFFDVVDAMVSATPVDPALLSSAKLDSWKQSRGTAPPLKAQHGDGKAGIDNQIETSSISSGGKAAVNDKVNAARVPPEVPQLPGGYQPRQAILDGIKKLIFQKPKTATTVDEGGDKSGGDPQPPSGPKPSRSRTGGRGAALAASVDGVKIVRVSVQGLGGSGKTIVAAGLCRDLEIATAVELIVYVALGQTPVIRECQKTMYRQLTGSGLDPNIESDEDAMSAIMEATSGKRVLLVLDDAWTKEMILLFETCLDSRTDSRLVVTTRIKSILPNISEFELGLLEPDDAASLLLEVAGEEITVLDGGKELLYKACELCGHLPLMLSIAGSMLAQYGEGLNEEFLALLQDDTEVTMRIGEQGDELVDLEDRLINSSLRSYTARDKAEVERLFYYLAILPEDVPLTMTVLKALSPHLEGSNQKHPGRKLRSWVTALIHLSLLKGSITDGIYMHDIVRHFCQSKVGEEQLRANHKLCVDLLLSARSGDPKAFEAAGGAAPGGLSYYCHSYLSYHIREALEDSTNIESCENNSWLSTHLLTEPDMIALASFGIAVGGPTQCQEICAHLISIQGREVEAASFLLAASYTRLLQGVQHTVEADLLAEALRIICKPEIIKDLSEVLTNRIANVFHRLEPLLISDPERKEKVEVLQKIFNEHCTGA